MHSKNIDRTIRSLMNGWVINSGYLRGLIPSTMQLYIGSDHAGFELKQVLLQHLQAAGHTVVDNGTSGPESVDYPDHAHAVAEGVAADPASLGIVVCGSGNGVNITANKHAGIRSALAWNKVVAALARQHNNANVLALPARFISIEDAIACVDAFLQATFEGGRHQTRVAKIESNC
jgi:ribose 5-phosphate isomerase B